LSKYLEHILKKEIPRYKLKRNPKEVSEGLIAPALNLLPIPLVRKSENCEIINFIINLEKLIMNLNIPPSLPYSTVLRLQDRM
jgi:hypothetical protein